MNPDNYLGSKSNTASTRMFGHCENAYMYFKLGADESAMKELGRALHFIQDISEPHHSSNITAVQYDNVHGKFESLVNEKISSYIDNFDTVYGYNLSYNGNQYNYVAAMEKDLQYLIDGAATISFQYSGKVKDPLNQSEWTSIGKITATNATAFSALLPARFYYKSGWQPIS